MSDRKYERVMETLESMRTQKVSQALGIQITGSGIAWAFRQFAASIRDSACGLYPIDKEGAAKLETDAKFFDTAAGRLEIVSTAYLHLLHSRAITNSRFLIRRKRSLWPLIKHHLRLKDGISMTRMQNIYKEGIISLIVRVPRRHSKEKVLEWFKHKQGIRLGRHPTSHGNVHI